MDWLSQINRKVISASSRLRVFVRFHIHPAGVIEFLQALIENLRFSHINGGNMKLKGLLFLTALLVMASPLVSTAQSGEEYRDPEGKYKINLLGDWKAISYKDAVGREKTEFVYRDRGEGLLKISRESLSGDLNGKVREEEENLRLYRAGFERAASEDFGSGDLRGLRFSFYTTESYRPKANTYYYLKDGNSVWVLRFSGRRGALDTIRNLTDQMARSFKPL